MEKLSHSDILKAATDIIVALLARSNVEPDQLPALVARLMSALSMDTNVASVTDALNRHAVAAGLEKEEAGLEPASRGLTEQQVRESISDDYITCFEDGKPYRSLRRHLMARYGLTPDEYRAKWGLPSEYPMVAPSYARERSAVAKRIGLGRPDAAHDRLDRRGEVRRRR